MAGKRVNYELLEEKLKNIEEAQKEIKDFVKEEFRELNDGIKERFQKNEKDIETLNTIKLNKEDFQPARMVVYAVITLIVTSLISFAITKFGLN